TGKDFRVLCNEGCLAETWQYLTEAEAIAAWNRRAAPAAYGLEVVERLMALADTPAGTGYADAVMNVYAELPVRQFFSDLLALSTQVQRLTEGNEALRKERERWEDRFFKMDANFDRAVSRAETAEASIKALEEALS